MSVFDLLKQLVLSMGKNYLIKFIMGPSVQLLLI